MATSDFDPLTGPRTHNPLEKSRHVPGPKRTGSRHRIEMNRMISCWGLQLKTRKCLARTCIYKIYIFSSCIMNHDEVKHGIGEQALESQDKEETKADPITMCSLTQFHQRSMNDSSLDSSLQKCTEEKMLISCTWLFTDTNVSLR